MKKICLVSALAAAFALVSAACSNDNPNGPDSGSTKTATATITPSASITQTHSSTPTITSTPTFTATMTATMTSTTVTVDISASQDTGIIAAAPADNYGSTIVHSAGFDGAGARRILMQFDLSSIPVNAVITAAELYFTVSTFSAAEAAFGLSAHAVSSAWGETTETWNTHAGGDFNAVSTGTAAVTSTSEWVMYISISTVQQWVSGSLANNGLLLKQEVENTVADWISIYMKETSAEAEKPYLKVTYRY